MGERGVPGPVGLKGQQGECLERTRRVAFSVVRNTDLRASGTSLPFQKILFEEGTNFDLPAGTFTCNVTGIYVFMFSFLKHYNAGNSYAKLIKKTMKLLYQDTPQAAVTICKQATVQFCLYKTVIEFSYDQQAGCMISLTITLPLVGSCFKETTKHLNCLFSNACHLPLIGHF